MTISELIKRSYGQAKNSGFWDQERNTGELKALIVSEMMEALEAHRKGRRVNLGQLRELVELRTVNADTQTWQTLFTSNIKDTFEDEIADTIIRICDYLGGCGIPTRIDNSTIETLKKFDGNQAIVERNIGEWLWEMTRVMTQHDASAEDLEFVLVNLFGGCGVLGIDIERHLILKMAFNETRPRLHDKNY